MLIIQGRTRRTGARDISVEATRAWDLRDEWERWKVAHPTNNSLAGWCQVCRIFRICSW
jgi:error-prone DNA polymerase